VNDATLTVWTGQAACLGAALLWALALNLFRGPIEQFGPRNVNTAKCLLAGALQAATVVVLGQANALGSASARSLLFVAASGLVGISIGDTALFTTVRHLGVHRALLMQTTSPVFTALIAVSLQGERLSLAQSLGALITLAGVAVVVAPSRSAGGERPRATGSTLRRWALGGVALGTLSALAQAIGIVMAKEGMAEVPVLASSALRLSAAALGLVVLAVFSGGLGGLRAALGTTQALRRIVPATFLGAYLAIFLMMAGIALAPASIAAVLLTTSPIFSLVFEAAVFRRPVTVKDVVGTLAAIAGVVILTLT
jgi:drug/metabolite transporter (DMT)-like permease